MNKHIEHTLLKQDSTKEEFIKYLGRHQISIFSFDNKEEFLEEVDNA